MNRECTRLGALLRWMMSHVSSAVIRTAQALMIDEGSRKSL